MGWRGGWRCRGGGGGQAPSVFTLLTDCVLSLDSKV
jgi:hypothetical protein